VKLLGRFDSPPLVVTSMVALLVATLTTNIAANVVPPANSFSNLAPRHLGYVGGGLITAVIGILMMPWKLITSTQGYIFVWLVGYSALLGPIAGIMIADYFVVRRATLHVPDLYREDGRYGRWNGLTIAVFAVAVLPSVPGFCAEAGFVAAECVPDVLREIYRYAWFVGFAIAFILHAALARRDAPAENHLTGKEAVA
jgi:NCS1 family nucleobase:cation symporter-1